MPSSRLRCAVAHVLSDEGFVGRTEVIEGEGFPVLRVYLKYDGGKDKEPVLHGLERVSKPGKRVYASHKEIPWVRAGLGINIVSTPKGLMTGREARRARWQAGSRPPP